MSTQTQLTINLGISAKLADSSVKSFQLSKKFIKNMVKCSIFNIVVNRLRVNASELKDRYFDSFPFYVVKKRIQNTKDPHIRLFSKWAKGIDDSIEKGFLKEIYLILIDPQKNDILESYKLKLKYNFENQTTTNTDDSLKHVEVRKEVVQMLQLVRQLGDQERLNAFTEARIEFKYNDITPFEYEPPGFRFTPKPMCEIISPFNTHLGTVNTGFHKLCCMGGTRMNEKENCLMDKEDVFETAEVLKDPQPQESKRKVINISNVTISVDGSTTLNSEIIDVEDISKQTDCFCNLVIPNVKLINCVMCKTKFHEICAGFLDNYDMNLEFRCANCNLNDSNTSIDNYTQARLRLILYYCRKDMLDDILPVMSAAGSDVKTTLKEVGILNEDNVVDYATMDYLIAKMFRQENSQFLEIE